jgi:hypothetical protein
MITSARILLLLAILASCSQSGGPIQPNDTTPPASAGHDLVYHDSLRAVLLVNAGLGGPDDARMAGQRTRLWSWDGNRWSLIDSAGPPVRNLGGVAYDAGRDKLVLYGGTFSANLSYSDTWEWDRRSGWRQLQVSGPGTRDHTQMTYDAERGVVILFGGQSTLSNFPADTWQWDGTRWSAVATAGPPARVHHALSFDPITRRVVLFGGVSTAELGDTWIWDGSGWSAQSHAARTPRTHARLAAFGLQSTNLLLIGGMTPSGLASDYLAWDGSTWNARAWSGPAPRYLPGVAYDKGRNVVVLFGGGTNNRLLGDTWEFDGSNWRRAQ